MATDEEEIVMQTVSFSDTACFVIFLFIFLPERRDETPFRPGGNVFSLRGCGVRASSLIKSIFLPQCCLEEEGKMRRKRERVRATVKVWGGYPID